ncbi:glycosyltransferase family 4 protein [Spirochaetota bacterium]
MSFLYIFNNGVISKGMSGSETWCDELIKVWLKKKYRIKVFAPRIAEHRFAGNDIDFISTDNSGLEPGLTLHIAFSLVKRTVKTLLLLHKAAECEMFFCASDNIADNIPAFYFKLKNPGVKWVTGTYLIAPSPIKGYKNAVTGKVSIPGPRSILYYMIQKFVYILIKLKADTVMVLNHIDEKELAKRKFDPKKILVVYGAIDHGAIKAGKKMEKRYDAVFVGREHPQKGIPDLLEVWEYICGRMPDVKLGMIGNFRSVEDDIRKKGLENNILLLGYMNGSRKYDCLRSAKVFLLPSYYESFAVVAVEAMACRLPIIAYDLPVFREIYTQGMLFVPIGDRAKMAETFLKLIKNDDLREKYSGMAYEHSKKFRWEDRAESILKSVRNHG